MQYGVHITFLGILRAAGKLGSSYRLMGLQPSAASPRKACTPVGATSEGCSRWAGYPIRYIFCTSALYIQRSRTALNLLILMPEYWLASPRGFDEGRGSAASPQLLNVALLRRS